MIIRPASSQAQDRESSPVKDLRFTTVLRRQLNTLYVTYYIVLHWVLPPESRCKMKPCPYLRSLLVVKERMSSNGCLHHWLATGKISGHKTLHQAFHSSSFLRRCPFSCLRTWWDGVQEDVWREGGLRGKPANPGSLGSASDSFSTMALCKSIYLLTYLLTKDGR